ncbi:hypothetical protein [uncultured Sphingopyxis sp.]|uniref:hypothetical protein n=1 Tax=uncultured Sphingopyxis sp. TaxID=310581 RepID=UPI002591B60C|nr:hypothetical protein [uncultured Sphingopyxis sp.]
MKTSFNREIAMDFLICLGRMITLRREVDGIPFREAAFTVAEAGNEHGFEPVSYTHLPPISRFMRPMTVK